MPEPNFGTPVLTNVYMYGHVHVSAPRTPRLVFFQTHPCVETGKRKNQWARMSSRTSNFRDTGRLFTLHARQFLELMNASTNSAFIAGLCTPSVCLLSPLGVCHQFSWLFRGLSENVKNVFGWMARWVASPFFSWLYAGERKSASPTPPVE